MSKAPFIPVKRALFLMGQESLKKVKLVYFDGNIHTLYFEGR